MATDAQASGSVDRSRGVALLLGPDAEIERVRERLAQAPEAWGILSRVVPAEGAAGASVPADTRLVVADYGGVPAGSRAVVMEWLKRAARRFQESAPGRGASRTGARILVRADNPDDRDFILRELRPWAGQFLIATAADLLPQVSEWLSRLPYQPNWFGERPVTRAQIETTLRELLNLGVPGAGDAVRWQPLVSRACVRLDTLKGGAAPGSLLHTHLQAVKDEILWKSRLGVAEDADLVWATEFALATVLAASAVRWKEPPEGGNFLARARAVIDPRPPGPVPVRVRPGALLALAVVALGRLLGGRAAGPAEPVAGVRAGAAGAALDVYATEGELFARADEDEFPLRAYRDELAAGATKLEITVPPIAPKAPEIASPEPRPAVSFVFASPLPDPV